MNIIARCIVASFLSLAILLTVPIGTTSSAQTPAKSLKDQLVGHWQLVSVSVNGNAPYGTAPQGSMFFDAAGHYSVIVITVGRARNIAYFGSYAINDADGSITMHIDASSGANAAGRDQKRLVTINGDELTLVTPPATGPIHTVGSIKLTWKRAE